MAAFPTVEAVLKGVIAVKSNRFAAFACVMLAAGGEVTAKEYLLRYDVVEVEFAKEDQDRTGEPVKTTFRQLEVKIDEKGAFSSTRVDQGWDLAVSGKGAGFHADRLRVEGLTFEYGPKDRSTRSQSWAALEQIPNKVQYQGGGARSGSATVPSQVFVFVTAREPVKTDRENDAWCAEARKSMLEQVAKMRKEHIAEVDNNEKAAARLLELAREQLKKPESDGVGRVLLETVIQKFGETKAAREAKKTWNGLPGVKAKYPLDEPVRPRGRTPTV